MSVRKIVYLFLVIGTFVSCLALKRSEILGINGKYLVEWEVDFDTEIIVFTVDVQTTGFVGFGISSNPSMAGADIVIGGVKDDQTTYFADYHAPSNGFPQIDEFQNWELLSATESNEHTILRFSRKLNTCAGDEDVAITNDTQYLIWAIGDTDDITYHGADPNKRGPKIINLLDPPKPATDLTQHEIFQIRKEYDLLPVDTTYWCTIHKAPNFNGVKHHIVAFNTTLTSPTSIKHTHHAVLYFCEPPAGESPEYFEKYLNHTGGECNEENPVIPSRYCTNALYIWAVGGEMLVLPEETGYPIGDSGRQEYLMFEVHIDNPELVGTGSFETGVEVFYTRHLRAVDAGVFAIAHAVNHLQIIPPRTDTFVNIAHCSSECTAGRISEEGISLINVMFHAHKAGKKMRTRIIRDGIELPWLAVDNHYNFDYQANRPFQESSYRKVLPGDHIITECTYDTSTRPNVTIGGHPSLYEMCQVFFWHYPKSIMYCDSTAKPDLKEFFGIENFTENGDEPILTKPDEIAGFKYSEYLNTLNWTDDFKNRLQQELRYGPHETRCLGSFMPVSYPVIREEYVEPNVCQAGNSANLVRIFSLSVFNVLAVIMLNHFWK